MNPKWKSSLLHPLSIRAFRYFLIASAGYLWFSFIFCGFNAKYRKKRWINSKKEKQVRRRIGTSGCFFTIFWFFDTCCKMNHIIEIRWHISDSSSVYSMNLLCSSLFSVWVFFVFFVCVSALTNILNVVFMDDDINSNLHCIQNAIAPKTNWRIAQKSCKRWYDFFSIWTWGKNHLFVVEFKPQRM